MSTKQQPPEKNDALFDRMIPHVRYEVEHVLDFFRWSNGWCYAVLNPGLDKLTSESLLEAALIHMRGLIEFLNDKPKADRICARDYLRRDWSWEVTDRAKQIDDLHGRVAHLGTIRADVKGKRRAFDWAPWFIEQAPNVLRTFREFLTKLEAKDARRYGLFVDGNYLLAKLDLAIGPVAS